MNLQWSGTESISAPKAEVWRFINDPRNIASCLPDVLETTVHDDHNFDVTVQVAVGPVRGKFKFKITLVPQPGEQQMDMKISGGGFGSVVDQTASADLTEDGTNTRLDWRGKATMRGPLATVGGGVLDAQARRVISTTFANVKARMAAAPA